MYPRRVARRGTLRFYAAVIAIIAVVPVAWFVFFREPPPPPAPPLPPPKPAPAPKPAPGPAVPTQVSLASLEGRVLVRHGAKGPFTPASAGTLLGPDDTIRTAPGASVDLVAGDHRVHLVPGTDVQVKELTADLSRFLLGTGMVTAKAAPGAKGQGRELQVDVKGTDVAARARHGAFTMSSNGKGTVKVASRSGEVHVAARGKEVVLRGREETLVRPGQAPGPPRPAATSLLLHVRWPPRRALNHREITVAGRTDAGALVFVAGRPVRVDASGRFHARVRLEEGANRVDVAARDVAGNRGGARSPHLVVDTRGAKARFDTQGLWGK